VGKRGYGTKEGESGTGRVWAAGFHHVTARSGLARVFETYEPFIFLIFQIFFSGRGQPLITGTADNESADTAGHPCLNCVGKTPSR